METMLKMHEKLGGKTQKKFHHKLNKQQRELWHHLANWFELLLQENSFEGKFWLRQC